MNPHTAGVFAFGIDVVGFVTVILAKAVVLDGTVFGVGHINIRRIVLGNTVADLADILPVNRPAGKRFFVAVQIFK